MTGYEDFPADLDDVYGIDFSDFAVLGLGWRDNNTIPAVNEVYIEKFESYVLSGEPNMFDTWQVLNWGGYGYPSGSLLGTSTLSLLTDPNDANSGSKAMRWVYDVNVNPDVNAVQYTEILVELANDINLGVYWDGTGDDGDLPRSPYTTIDQIQVMLKRHAGNSPGNETFMYAMFLNDIDGTYGHGGGGAGLDKYDIAKVVVGGATDDHDPNTEWDRWTIDIDRVDSAWPNFHWDLEHVGAIIFGIQTQPEGPYGVGTGTIDVDDIILIDKEGCSGKLAGDFDEDCEVNFVDVKIFTDYWLMGK